MHYNNDGNPATPDALLSLAPTSDVNFRSPQNVTYLPLPFWLNGNAVLVSLSDTNLADFPMTTSPHVHLLAQAKKK